MYDNNNINIPSAINPDGSIRQKKDPYDYGLTEYNAECEYHHDKFMRKIENYSPLKRKYRGA